MTLVAAPASEAQDCDNIWTIRKVLTWSTSFLTDRGSPTARLDSEVLLARTLKCQRIQLYLSHDKPLTIVERDQFKAALRRRGAGEPVAYIVGEKEFMGISFAVNRDVLIPRADTEILVELALVFLKELNASLQVERPLKVLEIGTGSGCIAVALAKLVEGADVKIEAWDVSEAALKVAQENSKSLGIGAEKIKFMQKNALQVESWNGLEKHSFDLIVANPPYICTSERDGLMPSVKDFEPHLALFAEAKGLEFYDVFAKHAAGFLAPHGKLMFEIGWQQAAAVCEMFKQKPWNCIKVSQDFEGRDRVVIVDIEKKEI